MNMYLELLTTNEPLFNAFATAYPIVFLLAILSLGFSAILRSKRVFFIQAILFLAMFVFDKMMIDLLYLPLAIVQIVFTVFLIYRTIKAVHYDYFLIMEKTNQIERQITKDKADGTRSSFF